MPDPHDHHLALTDHMCATLRKAARERRRGDFRRAMALLKRAAFEAQDRPGLWTRYALACMSAGQTADGARAFSQAVWMLERRGQTQAAAVTRQLAEIARSGHLPDNYARRRGLPWHAFAQERAAPSKH